MLPLRSSSRQVLKVAFRLPPSRWTHVERKRVIIQEADCQEENDLDCPSLQRNLPRLQSRDPTLRLLDDDFSILPDPFRCLVERDLSWQSLSGDEDELDEGEEAGCAKMRG